jgi:hypothetical protein
MSAIGYFPVKLAGIFDHEYAIELKFIPNHVELGTSQ